MFSAWNDQQTSHFYCKRQDFHPFSWQILVLPALALPIRNLCLPMEPSAPTTSPALLPPTRWLCWADCLWPQSLVKNSFFIFGLSSSANIFYKLTSTLYAGFLTFFYKVDKFKAFSLFFRGLEISLLRLQGRGGNVIHWFHFEMQSTVHLPYIIPSKLHIQLFTLQVQPASLFLHYSCSHQSSIFLHGPHFSVYQLPFALDGYSPLFFC